MSKIDETDREIVNLLMENGRLSCTQIGRLLGLSQRKVRYRIERMQREGVIRVCAIPNPKALGFPVTADVFLEVEPGRIPEVARHMAQYECVTYVACSTGERDISIQVVARDNAELYHFVAEVVGKVPGVRRTTTILVPLILKDVYDWRIPGSVTQDKRKGGVAREEEQLPQVAKVEQPT
ncbi:MAG: Lrp/AsnC family transcriptional regulator [Bryobacteraceae bacterium]